MTRWKPDIRPPMPFKGDPEPVCGHGYGWGHGCIDCKTRTWLANLGWRERGVAELPEWEEMVKTGVKFEDLTVAGQRDELLAAVAYLMNMNNSSPVVDRYGYLIWPSKEK